MGTSTLSGVSPTHKMSNQTTLRYELGAGKNQDQRTLQQERIRSDQLNDRRINDNARALQESLNADWGENLEENRIIALYKQNRGDIKFELNNANKATIRVRRAKLVKLLMQEEEEINKRLRAKGVVKFHDRIGD